MNHGMRPAGARALALLIALGLGLGAMSARAAEEPPRLTGKVNINTASVEELQLLPGIGATRAEAIVAERKRRGGFKRVEDLLEVKGIGEASLARLRPYVTIEGKTSARLE
jgi:competence protein ComEA